MKLAAAAYSLTRPLGGDFVEGNHRRHRHRQQSVSLAP